MNHIEAPAGRRLAQLATQFGHPRGLLGRMVGAGMARGNAPLNDWIVAALADQADGPVNRIAELGSGPGVGLRALAHTFPHAHIWGIDASAAMVSQARRRVGTVNAARVTITQGDTSSLADLAPLDLVLATHVLYFWTEPTDELARIRQALRAGGTLALGYQRRDKMPTFPQKHFPQAGHILYDTDDQVRRIADTAGFTQIEIRVHGAPEEEYGRVLIARS